MITAEGPNFRFAIETALRDVSILSHVMPLCDLMLYDNIYHPVFDNNELANFLFGNSTLDACF